MGFDIRCPRQYRPGLAENACGAIWAALPLSDDPIDAADELFLKQMCAGIEKFEICKDVAATAFDAGP